MGLAACAAAPPLPPIETLCSVQQPRFPSSSLQLHTLAPTLTGTLQQAVLLECLTGIVCAIPFLWLTRVRQTADWQMATALVLFGVRCR